MMNKYYILGLIFISSSILADEPLALITKSRGNVKYSISSESKFRSNEKSNIPIFHGNKIKTKEKSFSQIVYLDDRSTISAYPKTELTINGTIENRIISKQVYLTAGIVRVQVVNHNENAFKLTTPHSELTCHQCEYWVVSDKNKGDRLHQISGNVLVTNPSMIDTIKLVNDSTVSSIKNQGIDISKMLVTDSNYLELLMIDADELPEKTDKKLAMKSNISKQSYKSSTHILEIKLKNALNIERKIILTYTKCN